jgi:hypothetical protein
MKTRFQDIVANDLDVIEQTLHGVTDSLHRQFANMLYSTVSQVCEVSGNTVNVKEEGSFEAAFMAMLEKIEFSVDRDGNVSMPEIHGDSRRMLAALENSSPEYKERVAALKERKRAEALARETDRRGKFVQYGRNPCES